MYINEGDYIQRSIKEAIYEELCAMISIEPRLELAGNNYRVSDYYDFIFNKLLQKTRNSLHRVFTVTLSR